MHLSLNVKVKLGVPNGAMSLDGDWAFFLNRREKTWDCVCIPSYKTTSIGEDYGEESLVRRAKGTSDQPAIVPSIEEDLLSQGPILHFQIAMLYLVA